MDPGSVFTPRSYRELLKKYITYVGEMEGVDFLKHKPQGVAESYTLYNGEIITEEEMTELVRISDEIK